MTINDRTEEVQELLNSHMRRKDVPERILFESLNAEPASQEQVKRFLTAAPPEVFVLLDGLLSPPSPAAAWASHYTRTESCKASSAWPRRAGSVTVDERPLAGCPSADVGRSLTAKTAALG
jgi:hypothetical protein